MAEDSGNKGEGGKGDEGNKGGTEKTPDLAAELAAMKASHAELTKKLSAYEENDKSLIEKAKGNRQKEEKNQNDMKAIEHALKFSLSSQEWLKTHQSLLPKEINEIFTVAEKEKYDSAIEKANALKSGVIQSFFSVQANVDLLTPALKSSLDDYLKLTQTGKQEKASSIYDTVFEPAFETLKRVKKAEVVNKGYGDEGDFDVAYKNKMMKLSKEAYLGGNK